MSYRLRYQWAIDWVGDGQGPMSTLNAPLSQGGGAQTLQFFNTPGGQNKVGAGTSPVAGAIVSSDISTLTTNAASDMASQMTVAAVLTRLQNFTIGGA